jgi:hypothetical protein
MIGVGMADKNNRNFFPAEVEPPQGNLCSLSAVKKKKVPFPP